MELANYEYFVDKSAIISEINASISTPNKYLCITRPRRFGKTLNAMMLASYYSKNADFKELFDKLEISKSISYKLTKFQIPTVPMKTSLDVIPLFY